jgi:hypothetical protein
MGAIKVAERYTRILVDSNVCLHFHKTIIAHYFAASLLDEYCYFINFTVLVIQSSFSEALKFIAFILSGNVTSKCPSRAVILVYQSGST